MAEISSVYNINHVQTGMSKEMVNDREQKSEEKEKEKNICCCLLELLCCCWICNGYDDIDLCDLCDDDD